MATWVLERWPECSLLCGTATAVGFPEFVDAIQRAAMLKFDTDHKTPVDLKIHEMCLLLIFGPAGPLVAPPARSAVPPALAGVERRVSALGM